MKTTPRIMIVEDERLIALDLSKRLPKLGYEVAAIVQSGEEAVVKAQELKPSLVLMDVCLRGDMDGIQAAEVIRERSDIPVIFLTANSDEVTLSRAKHTRPSSYLLKPFKERELQIGIDMALLNHALNQELQAARDTLEQRVVERTAELATVNQALLGEIEVRKRMEAQAREQADLLAKARDAIYVRDLSGVISYWNRSAERLYGISAKDAIGRKAPSLLGESDEPNATKAEAETVRSGEWTGELRHMTTGGQVMIVESRWTLVRDSAGAPKTILIVNTDITDRKRIAEQFLRTQRLESIGALASGIAHDLNNVFAPILMATDLLTGEGGPDNARILEMVNTTAKRGADMVKQVLMFVRGGDNQMEPMTLDHLTGEVRRLMQETLPCSIEVTSSVPKNLPPILGDPTQLHQVLVNLCVNARDAMPEGGSLKLAVDEVLLDAAAVKSMGDLKPGRHVRLTVADTGTGITAEVKKKIFEPFFTTKEAGKGTGLGLSTVMSIVKAHHGFVDLDSAPGAGSRFIIHFPVCDFAQSEPEKEAEPIAPGQGELIMVVDDEQSVREITKLTLEVHNYRVLTAADGAEALSTYVQHKGEVALVITDIMMPVMNGRALMHALQKFDPYLPMVVFTAADRSNPLIGTLDEETVPVLRKPVTPEQLLRLVSRSIHPAPCEGEAVLSSTPGTHFNI